MVRNTRWFAIAAHAGAVDGIAATPSLRKKGALFLGEVPGTVRRGIIARPYIQRVEQSVRFEVHFRALHPT